MIDREGSPFELGKRTLAIVVARCKRSRLSRADGFAVDARACANRISLDPIRPRDCSGTAEVLHRQLGLLEALAPDRVLVIEADAMRGIDYPALIDAHVAFGIGATLAVADAQTETDGRFGCVTLDNFGRVLRIEDDEAPRSDATRAGHKRIVCAGAYVLDRELLIDCLEVDIAEPTSTHDFRSDVLPVLIRANGVAAHRAFGAEPLSAVAKHKSQTALDAS